MLAIKSIDKNKICNVIRKNYPELLGIRKSLQRAKVLRLYRYTIPEDLVLECETHPDRIEEAIRPYLRKWNRKLRPVINEMETVISNSPLYRDMSNIEEIKNDMLFCRLAYGFLPSEYAGFHFENKSSDERKKFASDIDTNVFGYSVNDIAEIQNFIDKGEGYKRTAPYYRRDAVVVETSKDYHEYLDFVRKHPVFVKKKVFSSMGKGVELIDTSSIDEDSKQLFDEIISKGKHLLEEKVVQHELLAAVNPSSVNTIRCITFNTVNGFVIPYCFFKAGRNGAFVDNAGAGGIVVGVDPQTGVCFTDGFTEYGEQYTGHPESKVVFKGFKLPDWQDMISICKEISSLFPKMKYLSYDLAYSKDGWVLIEVNEVGQFIIPQIVQQRGIKEELWHYLGEMDKVI